MDFESFAIDGVQLMVLAFGLVQFIKELFGLEGKIVTGLSAALGVFLMVLFQLIGVLPEAYALWLGIIVKSVAFGLAASGYYKFVSKRLPKQPEYTPPEIESPGE